MKYLDEQGVSRLWDNISEKFQRKEDIIEPPSPPSNTDLQNYLSGGESPLTGNEPIVASNLNVNAFQGKNLGLVHAVRESDINGYGTGNYPWFDVEIVDKDFTLEIYGDHTSKVIGSDIVELNANDWFLAFADGVTKTIEVDKVIARVPDFARPKEEITLTINYCNNDHLYIDGQATISISTYGDIRLAKDIGKPVHALKFDTFDDNSYNCIIESYVPSMAWVLEAASNMVSGANYATDEDVEAIIEAMNPGDESGKLYVKDMSVSGLGDSALISWTPTNNQDKSDDSNNDLDNIDRDSIVTLGQVMKLLGIE